MKFYGRAESVATRIVEQFQAGTIPKALAQVFIKRRDDIPCRSWSWTNQMLAALSGFDDARTYLDWQSAGRQVRKGERAFSILEPVKCKVSRTDKETGETVEGMAIVGFKSGARFGLEQTDIADADKWKDCGRDIQADRFLDALPFVNVARHWGLSVRSFNGRSGSALGKYRRGEAIAIGVENLSTWAHELIHAADDRLGQLTERGQHWRSETVAELGGAVLLCCIGQDYHADIGGCWDYIRNYAESNGKEPASACMSVLQRTCKAVAMILEAADEQAGKPESEAA